MAVYTHLAADTLADLVAAYDVGTLRAAKGIAEGVSNSNWLIETTGAGDGPARFILTMYERRIDTRDLPFFLGLLDHLSAAGAPVPRTIHDREGNAHRTIDGKAVALIEFLPGISVDSPNAAQARAVGRALADMHLAARDYPRRRTNALGPGESRDTLARCGAAALAGIAPGLDRAIALTREIAAAWPADLPRSVIHSDLFPDNVLLLGDAVAGMIDFYFACDDAMAYDLAVTHAAWSFDGAGGYRPAIGAGIVAGYEDRRALAAAERTALPLLARGACLRFVASRAEDWLGTPADALVARKDPVDFLHRHDLYAARGEALFAR